MKPTIALFHNTARSGATMVSKCIGCMNDIALLSEVSPFVVDARFRPIEQSIRFHQLLDDSDRTELKAMGNITWKDAVSFVHQKYQQKGMHLVLREWSHMDFLGIPWVAKPRLKSTAAEILEDSFDVKRFALVRHPLDQFVSLSKLSIMSEKLNLPDFLKGYRAYAEMAVEVGFVKYEDFTTDPDQHCQAIADGLDIPYDPTYRERWFSYDKITGDGDVPGAGRATDHKEITPLKRRPVDKESYDVLSKFPDFNRSIELLGYEM